MTPIQGYESRYAVTDDGEIFSYRSGKVLKPFLNNRGYPTVHLYKEGCRNKESVHRVVALNCIPNPDNLPEVNHKDGDKLNYHPNNLEWCTRLDNVQHGFSTGLIPTGENHHKSKLTQEQVDYCRQVYIRRDREFGAAALARRFGVTPPTMEAIVNKVTWMHS